MYSWEQFKTDINPAVNLDFGYDYIQYASYAWSNGKYFKAVIYELDATCEMAYDLFFAYECAAFLGCITNPACNTILSNTEKINSNPGTSNIVVSEAASSTKLAQNMKNAGMVRPEQSAAHHIVAGNAKMAEPARAILSKYKISINSSENGVFLPANKKSFNPLGSNIHSTLHTNKYYESINSMLSACNSKDEVLETLNIIKEMLLSGEF